MGFDGQPNKERFGDGGRVLDPPKCSSMREVVKSLVKMEKHKAMTTRSSNTSLHIPDDWLAQLEELKDPLNHKTTI